MEEQKPTKPCAHCRAELEPKETHWDHIPPKNLFPGGTTGIIQVPACRKCNNPDSKDDEYFRLLAMHIAADKNPSARHANDLNHRAITRPGARGFRKALSRKIKPVALRSPMGLFAGFTVSLEIEDERLKRTVSKITRGIYYHHQKRPVPEGYTVFPLSLFTLDRERLAVLKNDPEIANMPVGEIGKKTFQYKIGYSAEDNNMTVLIMRVYEWAEFMGLVLPEGTLNEARKNLTA